MLTKEKILEVLKANSSMLDGSVQVRNFVWVADALLELQGAVPEEAAQKGYITEECPVGYVGKKSISCYGCAFLREGYSCSNKHALCSPDERKDGHTVIFIRNEDAK